MSGNDKNSFSTTFIMNYFKGGGPRNVYMLARLLKEMGHASKVFSFYSYEDIPFLSETGINW